MKITGRMLREIAEDARKEVTNNIKHRHEIHEEFLARCWASALLNFLSKSGIVVNIELPCYDETVIEPLD